MSVSNMIGVGYSPTVKEMRVIDACSLLVPPPKKNKKCGGTSTLTLCAEDGEKKRASNKNMIMNIVVHIQRCQTKT